MNDKKSEKRGPRKPRAAERPRAGAQPAETGERIAKRLARAGIASRRDAEALIADGRVRVNGHVLDTPALNVTEADRIEIDGQPIPAIERTRLFLFHKPAGVVTTSRDPEGRRTVFDVLPAGLPRLVTVGRLDINTEGLLLLTNDGGLARVLELPQTGWLRRYRVRVHGEVDEAALAGLKDGIAVDGVFYGAVEAALERRQGTNAWLMVGLREGKNREVKNIMASLGLEVTRLIRVSFGPFQLAELGEGEVREIKGRTLRDQLGPRLIEEAGANFDAPLAEHAPAEAPKPRVRAEAGPGRPARSAPREEAGGLIKRFRRDREDSRDRALSRLSTTAPKRGERDGERPGDKGRGRTANVWIGPGGRPVGAKKDEPEEKVTRVARKPGDRKADIQRQAAEAARERPRYRARPLREDGDAAPKREWKPRPPREEAGDGPKRDWKAKPARPGKAERAVAKETGEAPPREYRPRPRREAAEGPDRPKREWKPRAEGAGTERPKREWKPRPEGEERPKRDFKPRADGPKREWKPRADGAGTERPKREWKPRPEGEERPKRDFKPRADGPKREWKPRAEGAGAERPKREWKPRPEGEERPKRDFKPRGDGPKRDFKPRSGKPGGRPTGGPRKGPPKGRPGGGGRG